jgi:hypothetical protein
MDFKGFGIWCILEGESATSKKAGAKAKQTPSSKKK